MNFNKGLKHQGLTICWSVIVLILCNMPISDKVGGSGFFFKGFDKMVHLGLFYVLTMLVFYGRKLELNTSAFGWLTIIKILSIAAIFGGTIELLQWKVFTYRSGEWWDFTCDMIGACMAAFGYVLLHLKNYNEKV